MSKTQEAPKLSLEALDDARQGGIGKGLIRNAITAIREALAEQKLSEPCRCGKQTNAWCMANTCSKAEQPAQEDPCTGCRKGGVCRTPKCGRLKLPVDHPLRSEQPAQQQEPESFEAWNAKQHGDPEEIGFLQALRIAYISGQDSVYRTSPQPSKPWVGLTDEEQNQVAWSCGAMSADWLDFARAIEAKLKEKNT